MRKQQINFTYKTQEGKKVIFDDMESALRSADRYGKENNIAVTVKENKRVITVVGNTKKKRTEDEIVQAYVQKYWKTYEIKKTDDRFLNQPLDLKTLVDYDLGYVDSFCE